MAPLLRALLRKKCGFVWVLLGLLGSGCGVANRVTVAQLVPILENAAQGAKESDDLNLVAAGLPANMLLMEGLVRTHPKNRDLLTLSAFMNFGYALGFVEAADLSRAADYYQRGKEFGWRALLQEKRFRRSLDGDLDDYRNGLSHLGRKEAAAMTWTALNWGRWISLNLESPAAIAQQPRFEALVERLLQVEPGFEGGLPHVVRGMYDALRPEMFGGNPKRSAIHFEQAFALSDRKNLLFLAFYAEFYCRQVLDMECFESTLEEIAEADLDDYPVGFQLMNEIAKERAIRLKTMKDEWF